MSGGFGFEYVDVHLRSTPLPSLYCITFPDQIETRRSSPWSSPASRRSSSPAAFVGRRPGSSVWKKKKRQKSDDMPLFLSEEEYESCLHNASLVAEKADAFIRKLYNQLESVKAQVGTASTTAEQSRSLLKQKSVSPCDELAQVTADEHQILLKYTKKDGEMERLSTVASELRALLEQKDLEISEKNAAINGYLDKIINVMDTVPYRPIRTVSEKNRHKGGLISFRAVSQTDKDGEIKQLSTEGSKLRTLLEQKDLEISEKNAAIKGYLDMIENLTDSAALKEARLKEIELELARSNASGTGLSQVGAKRQNPEGGDTRKIFVGGIPLTVTEDKFVECFSSFGKVSEHEIIRDPFGRSRGFGFIVFDSAGVVDTILDRGNKIDMEGTQVSSIPWNFIKFAGRNPRLTLFFIVG
ncbi:hypothetical protein RHSIM_Rhsim02G0129800 [Rhododendron simsii]|uniref:RRM domain-containing protein n=1 Tax=Rhododendron simsii TaxID=118357 RepID=A0A834HG50_RHOSS|nr:hypothetical protein RHSIM_Rhsim02G0129800 [Rhododendron simsii]